MTKEEFRHLERGDIVRHLSIRDRSFVVTSNFGDRVTAVATVDMTNPHEWGKVYRDEIVNK